MLAPSGTMLILLWRTPSRRWFAAIAAGLILTWTASSVMAKDTRSANAAYCVSANGEPGDALNVSLLQQGPEAPVIVQTGLTGPDGCGEFPVVPGGRPVMIVAWTSDGFSTGSTGWRAPDDLTGNLAIQLESRASPPRG